MSNKPVVNINYRDAPAPNGMSCFELAVSVAVLALIAIAVTGWGLRDLVLRVWFGW